MSPDPPPDDGASYSVVADFQVKLTRRGGRTHADLRCVRVFGGIRECLCHNVIRGNFDVLGQPTVDVDVERNGHGRPACERLDAGAEAAPGQDGGVNAARDLPGVGGDRRESGGDLGYLFLGFAASGLPAPASFPDVRVVGVRRRGTPPNRAQQICSARAPTGVI
jgi:hypothetical protein